MDSQRWSSLCSRLSCPGGAERFPLLAAAYAEGHRHHHTARHIDECLDLFQQVVGLADHPDEVELAIWMHDVVYRPRRSDNEARSADLAAEWLGDCEVDPAVIGRIRGLIMATRHADAPRTPDEGLIQDIDLAVLGAAPQRFAEYEEEVRREYRSVPSFIFRRRRAEILESFLERTDMYRTPWFRERLEVSARGNLSRAIAALRGSSGPSGP